MRERKRTRLNGFDYASPGAYFITAVIKGRLCAFGDIMNGTTRLNLYGEIVREQWRWLHQQYPYLKVDEFVVMPNHVHGIVNITDSVGNAGVGNAGERSLQKIKSLSELVGAFKSTSSKRIHQSGLSSFRWQKSFYERIIRNDRELMRIRQYIQTNPLRWELDIENPGGSSVQDYYDKILDPV